MERPIKTEGKGVLMKIDIRILYTMRGLLAILCGLTILVLSSPTIYSLSVIFTVYCLLEGIITLLLGLKDTEKQYPWWYLIGESVVNIAAVPLIILFATFLVLTFPRVSSILLLLLLSGRIILIGIIEVLVGAIRRVGVEFHVPIGLASIIFGLVMIYYQDKGIFFFAPFLGVYGITVGIFLILICFKVRDAGMATISPDP
jgi:uncharacterized membrane protein HdeD (DUF308 family)